MKILLDTNSFLIPGKFKVDIFEQLREEFGKLELYTLDLVVTELKKITKTSGKDSGYAKLGLELLKRNDVVIIRSGGESADDEIVRIGNEYLVFTQDKGLIRKLKVNDIRIITLRQGKYISKA
ncbi:MAG: hypothetical protein ISS36_01425 [Candidatus Aenigmarchaeota archaeon]|nr:hypothetical protein [Candidatus Aenigmarchaeota archaeon]